MHIQIDVEEITTEYPRKKPNAHLKYPRLKHTLSYRDDLNNDKDKNYFLTT